MLDYAKNVSTFENVSTGGDTADLPNDNARYCVAHIMHRANSWFISIEGRDNRLYTNYNNGNNWTGWQATALKSDLKVLKKPDVQFSNGFAEISFPGITYDSAVCINQEYRSSDGVQNLVFTAQVRPNELIIYARNADNGSSYSGILNIMVIAIG